MAGISFELLRITSGLLLSVKRTHRRFLTPIQLQGIRTGEGGINDIAIVSVRKALFNWSPFKSLDLRMVSLVKVLNY